MIVLTRCKKPATDKSTSHLGVAHLFVCAHIAWHLTGSTVASSEHLRVENETSLVPVFVLFSLLDGQLVLNRRGWENRKEVNGCDKVHTIPVVNHSS